MTVIYELDQMRNRNGGNLPPVPYTAIDGYSKGFVMMLSDGAHDGICFPGYETKAEAIEAFENSPAVPDGWHVYLLHGNGYTVCLNPRWELRAELVK